MPTANMKVLVVLAVLVACANASVLSNVVGKIFPSFPKSEFVIKGEEAVPGSATYIVSLSSKFERHSHICGGTIIDKNWILTAAHCISKAEGMGVIAGLHERSNVDEKTQARRVDKGWVHESYTGGVGPFDIAILHVEEPFEFNAYVRPAELPAADEVYVGEAHLYGWGQPKAYVLTAAKTLQTVQTDIIPLQECMDALPADAPIHSTNVCSSAMGTGVSACNGDSGGPLVAEHQGGATIRGIVSWGYIPCGLAKMPSIYTSVASHIGWIKAKQASYYNLFH